MYRLARKSQRNRLQTESSLTYTYLRPLLSEAHYLGPLRLINETFIQPGGALEENASLGSEMVLCAIEGRVEVAAEDVVLFELEAGDVSHIMASDDMKLLFRNSSEKMRSRMLEIWLAADLSKGVPEPQEARLNTNRGFFNFLPLASGQGHEDTVFLTTDCAVYLSKLRPFENLIFETVLSRSVLVFVLDGAVRLEKDRLIGGDSSLVFGELRIPITAQQQSAVILIDLPLEEKEGAGI